MSEARSELLDSTVETLASKLPERQELLLCLDFDGTLVATADDPDAVTVPPETRAAVAKLHSHPDVTVAIVSGRELADVRARVDVPGVTYAGNHGLELRTEGVTNVHPVAESYQSDVERTYARLRDAFDPEAGVTVENNGPTLTVHHRGAPERRVRTIRRTVALTVGEVASGTLAIRGGDEVIEVRPAVAWDEGSVVVSLLRERASCLPVFVGDSKTDEAGFRTVERDGVGIRVGDADPEATAATEFLRDHRETTALLEWLGRTGVDGLRGPVESVRSRPEAGAADDPCTKSN